MAPTRTTCKHRADAFHAGWLILCTGPDTALQTSGRVNLPTESLYLPRSGVIAPSVHVLTWTAGFLLNLCGFGAGVNKGMLDTGSLERLHGLSRPPHMH